MRGARTARSPAASQAPNPAPLAFVARSTGEGYRPGAKNCADSINALMPSPSPAAPRRSREDPRGRESPWMNPIGTNIAMFIATSKALTMRRRPLIGAGAKRKGPSVMTATAIVR
jgi:hypothetical protein